jgi:hypothetical protein
MCKRRHFGAASPQFQPSCYRLLARSMLACAIETFARTVATCRPSVPDQRFAIPARAYAWRIAELTISTVSGASSGGCCRTKSARLGRRTTRRCKYCTMAWPVVTGNGSMSMHLPLVHFGCSVPSRQLRSSSSSLATHTQPEVHQAAWHRIIAAALGAGAIEGAEEALDLHLGQRVGQ